MGAFYIKTLFVCIEYVFTTIFIVHTYFAVGSYSTEPRRSLIWCVHTLQLKRYVCTTSTAVKTYSLHTNNELPCDVIKLSIVHMNVNRTLVPRQLTAKYINFSPQMRYWAFNFWRTNALFTRSTTCWISRYFFSFWMNIHLFLLFSIHFIINWYFLTLQTR